MHLLHFCHEWKKDSDFYQEYLVLKVMCCVEILIRMILDTFHVHTVQ